MAHWSFIPRGALDAIIGHMSLRVTPFEQSQVQAVLKRDFILCFWPVVLLDLYLAFKQRFSGASSWKSVLRAQSTYGYRYGWGPDSICYKLSS